MTFRVTHLEKPGIATAIRVVQSLATITYDKKWLAYEIVIIAQVQPLKSLTLGEIEDGAYNKMSTMINGD
jgi:hypothetical protein